MKEPYVLKRKGEPVPSEEVVLTWRSMRSKVYHATKDGTEVEIVDGEGAAYSAVEILAVPINDLGYPTYEWVVANDLLRGGDI